jgi:hypothetical protein
MFIYSQKLSYIIVELINLLHINLLIRNENLFRAKEPMQ